MYIETRAYKNCILKCMRNNRETQFILFQLLVNTSNILQILFNVCKILKFNSQL